MNKCLIRIIIAIAACVPMAAAAFGLPPNKHVVVVQLDEHPALAAVRKGLRDVLQEAGWVPGENLIWRYENASSAKNSARLVEQLAAEQPDVMIAIATPAAQLARKVAPKQTIIFAAVTDPVAAKLVASRDQPGRYITGVSDLVPVAAHLALIKEAMPKAKRLGVLFNPNESNAQSLLELVKKHATDYDLSIVEASASAAANVPAASKALVSRADAIYLPTDNTVVSAIDAVIKVAQQEDIPVFAADTDSVQRGAIAALGFNYYDVGRQTGDMVVAILRGRSADVMPVQEVRNTELYVNPAAAERMGLELPSSLIQRAKVVVR